MTVTVLRFANGLGPDLNTSHMRYFALPVVPAILGFDPRYQFIHADDMAGALEHAVRNDLDGIYNGAADGVLALSEVAACSASRARRCCRRGAPASRPPALRRAGLRIPPEMLQQLRFGRAIDNRKLKATGYRYALTTRETVMQLREHQRIAPLLRRRATATLPLRARGRGVPAPQPERRGRDAREPVKAPGGRRATSRPRQRRGAAAGATTSSRPRRSSRCCPLEPAISRRCGATRRAAPAASRCCARSIRCSRAPDRLHSWRHRIGISLSWPGQ